MGDKSRKARTPSTPKPFLRGVGVAVVIFPRPERHVFVHGVHHLWGLGGIEMYLSCELPAATQNVLQRH